MKRILTTLALGSALAFGAMPAGASTITECQGLIATLSQETAATTFLGQNAAKDEAALLGKLGEASQKLDRAKLGDAAQKVADYQAKLTQLVNAGKLDQNAFAELSTDAAAVQTCIANIGQ